MTITQTVEIPEYEPSVRRRLTIDVPREIPAGPVILAFLPASPSEDEDATEYLMRSPATRARLNEAIKNIEEGKNLISFATLEEAMQAAQQ